MVGRTMPPFIVRWDRGQAPLPVREGRAPRGPLHGTPFTGQPWYDTGLHAEGLDFSGRMVDLLEDIIARCPAWQHLQVPRLLVGYTQAQARRVHGLQARVTPLRFAGGELQRRQR